jgi:hypothetical protein
LWSIGGGLGQAQIVLDVPDATGDGANAVFEISSSLFKEACGGNGLFAVEGVVRVGASIAG